MDESDDFCHTGPKRAKLIHAARLTVLRVDQTGPMLHLPMLHLMTAYAIDFNRPNTNERDPPPVDSPLH
jgi:hypothetical protein